MQYVYSRVSTDSQDTDNQTVRLKELYPQAIVFEEKCSSSKERAVLAKLISILEKGDVLIVMALDRLGRKTSEVLKLIEDLEKKGIVLKSVREGVDYSTITGKLVTQILCSVAEMERNLISERTKAALAVKKQKGIIGGRKPTFSAEEIDRAIAMRREGLTLKEISQATGISESRIHQLTRAEGIDEKKAA